MFPLSDSIPGKGFPLVNILLIVITIFAFIQEITAPNSEAFISHYALIPSLVDLNNYATLTPFITSIFLHGGFLHIITNMWFLWIFGDNVEGYMGKLLYPLFYLLSGIVGNIAQFLIAPHSSIPMLGASGAIAGVLGAYYVLFPQAKIKTLVPFFGFVTIFNISAPFMLGYWFILQIFSGAVALPFSSDHGGIAFWAHIGGFIAGVLIGNIIKQKD